MSLSLRAVDVAPRPVSDGAPAGANIRFEADFEALKAEMDKISGLAAEGIDWGRAAGLACDILEKRSKDLLVGSWLALALFHDGGYVGLSAGLTVLRSLVEGFWNDLFPEPHRMRARVSAIEWFVERAAATVAAREPSAVEAREPLTTAERLDALDAALSGAFGPDAPSVGDLRSALAMRVAAAPEPEPEPAPAPPPSAAPPASAATPEPVRAATPAPVSAPAPVIAPPPVPADLGSGDAIESALKDCLAALRTVATALRRANPRDPVAYRLARAAAWGRIRRPPADTDGLTRVPSGAVSTETAQRLGALLARGAHAELLEQSETMFAQSVLWLDLQWYTASALKALGPDYAAARQVVLAETAQFLRAFPTLPDLSFDSGDPFASGAARQWIDGEVLAAGAAGPARGAGAGGGADEALETARAAAQEKLDAGQAGEAIAMLQEIALAAPSRRDRFVRRLALARLLAGAGEARLAAAQLEAAEQEIAAFQLEEWEPRLCAEALELAYACQRAAAREGREGTAEGREGTAVKLDGLLSRLARVDAAAAMRLRVRSTGA